MDNQSQNKFSVNTTAHWHGEGACMFTESRLEHIDSMAERAERCETAEPRWDLFKVICPASGSLFISGSSAIISILSGKFDASPAFFSALLGATLLSAITTLLTFYISYTRDKERIRTYKSYITEIREIVAKAKKVIHESQGSDSQGQT